MEWAGAVLYTQFDYAFYRNWKEISPTRAGSVAHLISKLCHCPYLDSSIWAGPEVPLPGASTGTRSPGLHGLGIFCQAQTTWTHEPRGTLHGQCLLLRQQAGPAVS